MVEKTSDLCVCFDVNKGCCRPCCDKDCTHCCEHCYLSCQPCFDSCAKCCSGCNGCDECPACYYLDCGECEWKQPCCCICIDANSASPKDEQGVDLC